MEYKNERLGVSFSLPEKITVRQQLAYFSEAGRAVGEEFFIRLWYAARTIVQDWKCEAVPNIRVDLDEITDPAAAEIMLWAGMEVKKHIDRLETIPKN